MNKTMLCLALACAAGFVGAVRAADDGAGERYFALFGTKLIEGDDKRRPQLDDALGAEVRFGAHQAPAGWGYELRAFYEQLDETDPVDSGNRSGIGADALYRLPQFFHVTVYALGGGGFVYSDALPGKDWVAPMLNAGLGIETDGLRLIGGRLLRFRLEGRYSYEDNRDEYYTPTAYDPSNYFEPRVYAGLSWSLMPDVKPSPPVDIVAPEPQAASEAPAPEPPPVVAPEPAPAAEPAAPGDADNDGVPDDQDRCPDSPAGKPVDAEGCTILKVLTLKGVNFENNSAELRDESFPILDAAVAALNAEFPEARIEVAGHTDGNGSDSYNRKLSERRAQSVLDYLTGKGVAAERLTAVGYGEGAPVADNETAEGRAQNRRVELRVKSD